MTTVTNFHFGRSIDPRERVNTLDRYAIKTKEDRRPQPERTPTWPFLDELSDSIELPKTVARFDERYLIWIGR